MVVTGGARGLGYSLATAYAAAGLNVALVDILESVESSAYAISKEYGVLSVGLQADVTDAEAVGAAFEHVRDRLGLPTQLLTAAGQTIWQESLDVSPDEWRRVLNVNLDGTFFAAQSFGRGLINAGRSGSAVFVSSMSASIVNVPQHQVSYNVSKAAVSHLARSLAVEWSPHKIRVNAVSPGYFLSEMTRQFTRDNPRLSQEWVGRTPAARMGEPADLHGLVLLLASEASSYMTGNDVLIDGGYSLI